MSISEKVLEELEADVRLRKRFAELLVTEPDVRLAIINAVMRDVATKEDIEKLRAATKEDMEKLRVAMKEDIENLRSEISQLRTEINQLRGEMSSNLRWTIGVILTIWGATVIPILLRLIGAI